jgi:hypothetical protein
MGEAGRAETCAQVRRTTPSRMGMVLKEAETLIMIKPSFPEKKCET